jgi:hypothetical protein
LAKHLKLAMGILTKTAGEQLTRFYVDRKDEA